MKLAAVIVSALALLGLAVASPAYAQGCGGSGEPTCPSSTVTGTVTVPTSITLTLSTTTFSLTAPAGQTTSTGTGPFPVTATVTTNDASGYTLAESLTNPTNGFANSGATQTLSGADITPWDYITGTDGGGAPTNWGLMNDGFGVLAGPFGTTGAAIEVAGSLGPSAASGDAWGLSWQFAVPGNQAGAVYNGNILNLATAN